MPTLLTGQKNDQNQGHAPVMASLPQACNIFYHAISASYHKKTMAEQTWHSI